MSHKYHNYTDTAELEDVSRTPSNLFRYALMLFRPAGTLIICILLTIVVAIPCVLILITSKSSSIEYAVSMAIVTGVFASAWFIFLWKCVIIINIIEKGLLF